MEIQNVKSNLKKKWNINPYDFWIPLLGRPAENTLYFDTEDFEKEFGYENLNKILLKINIGYIFFQRSKGGKYLFANFHKRI